jgi:hypothetical protein
MTPSRYKMINRFFVNRKLDYLNKENREVPIREDPKPNWSLFRSFRERDPSWQNSAAAVNVNPIGKIAFGAFRKDKCPGHAVVFPASGSVPHCAVGS